MRLTRIDKGLAQAKRDNSELMQKLFDLGYQSCKEADQFIPAAFNSEFMELTAGMYIGPLSLACIQSYNAGFSKWSREWDEAFFKECEELQHASK